MKKINQYFDKIFVLTVGASQDRISTLQKRLQGLNYEFFEGVDGKIFFPELESLNIFPHTYFEENNIDFNRFQIMSKGQLGCALSHIKIYERIIESSFQRTLILEDDALLDINEIPNFIELIRTIPNNWELLYLGYKDVVRKQRIFPLFIQKIFHKLKGSKIYNIHFGKSPKYFFSKKEKYYLKGGVYLATYGYAISLEGAKKTLAYSKPVRYLADELLMEMVHNNKIISIAAKKTIINHSYNFESTT